MGLKHLRVDNKCPHCFVRSDLCFCDLTETFLNRNPISFLVHQSEMILASNTARLAHQTFKNSRVLVRGKKDERLDDNLILSSERENFFLYPTDDAMELSDEFVRTHPEIHLIVPDGNWEGTKKVKKRHSVLWKVPAVKLPGNSYVPQSIMRKGPGPGHYCTLEASAIALSFWEGEQIYQISVRNLHRLQLRVMGLREGGAKLQQMKSSGLWPPFWMKDQEIPLPLNHLFKK